MKISFFSQSIDQRYAELEEKNYRISKGNDCLKQNKTINQKI